MHEDCRFREPCNEGDKRDQQRRAGRKTAEARRTTAGKLAYRRADNQRNCRSAGSYSVARAAKDPEDQSSEKTGVKTGFRLQVRERRIPQRRGKQICGERNAGEKIAAQPRPI